MPPYGSSLTSASSSTARGYSSVAMRIQEGMGNHLCFSWQLSQVPLQSNLASSERMASSIGIQDASPRAPPARPHAKRASPAVPRPAPKCRHTMLEPSPTSASRRDVPAEFQWADWQQWSWLDSRSQRFQTQAGSPMQISRDPQSAAWQCLSCRRMKIKTRGFRLEGTDKALLYTL